MSPAKERKKEKNPERRLQGRTSADKFPHTAEVTAVMHVSERLTDSAHKHPDRSDPEPWRQPGKDDAPKTVDHSINQTEVLPVGELARAHHVARCRMSWQGRVSLLPL